MAERLKPSTEKFPLWRLPSMYGKVLLSKDYDKISPESYEAYVERFSKRSEQGNRISSLLRRYLPPKAADGTKKDVLDIAAGTGIISRALEEQGYNVTATDMSEKSLHFLQQKSPSIQVKQADMNEELPFADESFDAATSVWANRYMKDTDAFLKEVVRILRPGGVFLWPIYPSDRNIWKVKNGIRQHTTSKNLKKDALAAGFNEADVVNDLSLESSGRPRLHAYIRPEYLVLTK